VSWWQENRALAVLLLVTDNQVLYGEGSVTARPKAPDFFIISLQGAPNAAHSFGTFAQAICASRFHPCDFRRGAGAAVNTGECRH
jgi:hypothetical protein